MMSLTALLLIILLICQNGFLCNAILPPVIIVPGDGASPIEAKVSRKDNCEKTSDWYTLWPNVEDILFGNFPCTVENMALAFDPKTNETVLPEGIQTRVPGWGTAHVVEYVIDNFIAKLFHIAYDAEYFIKALVSWGYEKDVNIRGAPYDFRHSMASLPDFFEKLKKLVEDTSAENHGQRVALVSHSMGGLFATWFLNHQSQEWKDQYIHSFSPLSTPWGGSTEALQALTSGYNFHIPTVKNIVARKLQRSWETNYLLLPDYRFHSPDQVFIYTPTHNFTLHPKDMDLFFKMSGNKLGQLIYNEVVENNKIRRGTSPMPPHPGVATFCFYGVDVPTAESFTYPGNTFPDGDPTIKNMNGDSTVSVESLRGCKMWETETSQFIRRHPSTSYPKFYTEANEISGASHMDMFGNQMFLDRIKQILLTTN